METSCKNMKNVNELINGESVIFQLKMLLGFSQNKKYRISVQISQRRVLRRCTHCSTPEGFPGNRTRNNFRGIARANKKYGATKLFVQQCLLRLYSRKIFSAATLFGCRLFAPKFNQANRKHSPSQAQPTISARRHTVRSYWL